MPVKDKRYPSINIRSKNELAKRISSKNFTFQSALNLINNVLLNYNNYWNDNKKSSEPEKEKYVRSAYGTPLGKLLSLIDYKVLAPYDYLVPYFIFGGISDKDHVKAAYYLLGSQRKRTKLGLDISKFFEQNTQERVFYFFYSKCKCSKEAANILANLCCVPIGPKNGNENKKVLARGFATSTRLALWCNLDLFLRVYWQTNKILKHHNPKIAIFVDDIGITASRVGKEKIELLANKIEKIFESFDPNQTLPINKKKKNIQTYKEGNIEHLGLRLGKNKISFGKKTNYNQSKVLKKLRDGVLSKLEKIKLIKKKKSYLKYKRYIKSERPK